MRSAVVDVACTAPRSDWYDIRCVIRAYLYETYLLDDGSLNLFPGQRIRLDAAPPLLQAVVEDMRVCDVSCLTSFSPSSSSSSSSSTSAPSGTGHPRDSNSAQNHTAEIVLVFYTLHHDNNDDGADTTQGIMPSSRGGANYMSDDADGGVEELPSSTVLSLPHAQLNGLWESLSYGETAQDSVELKRDLIEFMQTAMTFSMANVDPHYIIWNRLLLFHGPPGTGKTSLCRALAHKLSVRMGDQFPGGARLVEINAHSLFSRWFSESGKQVMQLFRQIRRIASDPARLVCVLMDEVESLAAARQSAMKGNEPSDSIRVVNALLTQLDSLQRMRNVVVLATSNLTGAMDVAFLDRADKKVYVGPPGHDARCTMLRSSVMELLDKGLLSVKTESPVTEAEEGDAAATVGGDADAAGTAAADRHSARKTLTPSSADTIQQAVSMIDSIALDCEGFNGRLLRKLPFLAYSACRSAASFSPAAAVKRRSDSDNGDALRSPPTVVRIPISTYLYHLGDVALREKERRQMDPE